MISAFLHALQRVAQRKERMRLKKCQNVEKYELHENTTNTIMFVTTPICIEDLI